LAVGFQLIFDQPVAILPDQHQMDFHLIRLYSYGRINLFAIY